MAIEYNFTLDMDRSKRDNNIAYARTGDVDSITINADLVLNGTAYTPTGTNAFFECVTPNGHSVRAAAEKSGSSVSVEVPSAAFQAAGVINVAYFRFESGDADNPTYVESTEPFAIVVREGIGDNIDAGDYIEEWRQLADQLEVIVADVEQKAEQAETAINEQKTEVDQLKAQAQTAIAGDVTDVEEAAQSAITAINQEKADVADAAEDVSAAGEQAINTFNTNSQQAINQFNTNGTSAINQFNTNADAKLDEVDGMITEAQGDVDAAITQLEDETQNAIQAAQDALDGTTATNLQNAINRTLKLDVADMTNIPDNSSLSSFTNVGSYCCKTAATAATIGDCPIDDGPFNMYVFSSATSGQVMQLVVPIDLQGKPTAEWHVRFGTSSTMDPWSVIGGGADIAAGLGIDVTGDAQKTVSLDTTAFYQHHEATDIIQGSTEVTGGGRIKELKVYGSTRQNLWENPSGTRNGVTVTANEDGSITLSGTATVDAIIRGINVYTLRPNSKYVFSVDKKISNTYSATEGAAFIASIFDSDSSWISDWTFGNGTNLVNNRIAPSNIGFSQFGVVVRAGTTVSGTYRVMLNEGAEAEPWCPPGLNGVEELSIVTAGKNLADVAVDSTTSGVTISSEDDGAVSFVGTATYTYPQASVRIYLPTNMDIVASRTVTGSVGEGGRCYFIVSGILGSEATVLISTRNSDEVAFNTGEFDSYRLTVVVEGNGVTFNCKLYPQLERGSTATAYEPPAVTTTPVDLDGHALNSLPDGTRDELAVDASGKVTLVQRVGEAFFAAGDNGWTIRDDTASFANGDAYNSNDFDLPAPLGTQFDNIMCDAYAVNNLANYAQPVNTIRKVNDGDCALAVVTEGSKPVAASVIYPLAIPVTIELPDVTLSELASPDYTVYASSNVPAELEAEVVKVDYLPPSDVYTKEEVDQKIEDAGGMPDVVPVSQGGTGVTTAAAERNRLGLGNTTGAVPVANGGTGGTTAKAAQYNLLNGMNSASDAVNDDTSVVFAYGTGTSSNGAVYKRQLQYVWNWIVTKIRSTFGFNSSNVLPVSHGGTGGTSAKAAQNSLLNDMNVSSDSLSDDSMLVGYNASPSASNGAVHKRSITTIWDYIAGKVADKVWDQLKMKIIRGDTDAGTDLTLIGGLESMTQTRTSTLTLGVNEMSLDNSNMAPLTVNGEEVVTEGNFSSHLPAMFDAKSVWFNTPLKQGQQFNIITNGGFTLEEVQKYFVPGNLVLANFVCGSDNELQLEEVVPMVVTVGDGMIMQPTGITYNSVVESHFDCIFAVANNEQAGEWGVGLADGVTLLYAVTEVNKSGSLTDRTSTSSLKGFTVFDLVGHAI